MEYNNIIKMQRLKQSYSLKSLLKNENNYKKYTDIIEKIINEHIKNSKDSTSVIRITQRIKLYTKIMLFFLLIGNINYISAKNRFFIFECQFYEIILKIKGSGLNKIFGNDFHNNYQPNYIYINGNRQNNVDCIYNLPIIDNSVKLIWNYKIRNCAYMFCGCNNIYSFDFTNFDTSEVTTMYAMFYGCSSLISLNLSNFITSKVQVMWNMFSGCSSLISLNLSNFDTSQVNDTEYMFKD